MGQFAKIFFAKVYTTLTLPGFVNNVGVTFRHLEKYRACSDMKN